MSGFRPRFDNYVSPSDGDEVFVNVSAMLQFSEFEGPVEVCYASQLFKRRPSEAVIDRTHARLRVRAFIKLERAVKQLKATL